MVVEKNDTRMMRGSRERMKSDERKGLGVWMVGMENVYRVMKRVDG